MEPRPCKQVFEVGKSYFVYDPMHDQNRVYKILKRTERAYRFDIEYMELGRKASVLHAVTNMITDETKYTQFDYETIRIREAVAFGFKELPELRLDCLHEYQSEYIDTER